MILGLYAGMLRAGISMREIDQTDLHRYLRVLEYARGEHGEDKRRDDDRRAGKTILLERGYAEDIWG